MRKWLTLLLVLTLLMAGCSQPAPPAVNRPGKFTAKAAGIDSYNQFGFDLYQQLRNQENILGQGDGVSPCKNLPAHALFERVGFLRAEYS